MNSSALVQGVKNQSRHAKWELIQNISLSFPTHHPQGLAYVGEYIFLSYVEVLDPPLNVFDPVNSTPGRGVGHMFVLDLDGKLLKDIIIGIGDMYHPGGIDFDGTNVWVPVGEYRPGANSVMLSIDPKTFVATERFRVKDSIGWAVSDGESGIVYGGNWGSREFYTWGHDGAERAHWCNPSSFIDYQDSQYVGNGLVICSGIAVLAQPTGSIGYELGGIAVVDFVNCRIIHEMPIQLFSQAGHVLTRNPFALTCDLDYLYLHVAPDDGFDLNGTELLTYRAKYAEKYGDVPEFHEAI